MATINKTIREYLEEGYTLGDHKFQRGYVSRKLDIMDCCEGGRARGNRNNELYVLVPCYTSTRYCYRQYLIPPPLRMYEVWEMEWPCRALITSAYNEAEALRTVRHALDDTLHRLVVHAVRDVDTWDEEKD